ncbi:hypothetical protein GWG65_36065 [Bradyrhizobium sp. CSA207]|uniref:hypothetical protein n=1 Tax=Bradyrhizobium sp. CSA207 TaxID=2698826 RepID=UPI0023B071E1|nr:hypothetical protein [Bradyrhizobium sp. CSA207]MDE5446682.1 hypothetical protein [Bradyrhizobium sp. CSA207]
MIDTSQKEVVDLLVSHSGMSILISQKCQEDPFSRSAEKTTAWATKQAKKAFSQLRGALRGVEAKRSVWCDHRRRGRVEFPDGLPFINHAIVIVEVFERVELGPESDFPLALNGIPVTYLSVNDFLNLAQELRTLPEMSEYLEARRSLSKTALRTVGDDKTLYEYYLGNDGSFQECVDHVSAKEFATNNGDQLKMARAAKAESDRFSKLIEYIADQLATRLADYASGLPADILAAFDDPGDRKQYIQMQDILANLRLRERAELGRAFSQSVEALKSQLEGYVYRALYFDTRPDLVFVLASSKGVARREVLERGLVLTRAAMAHYEKSRAMLIVDRDGSGFEVSMIESASVPTEEEIVAGKRFFGSLRVIDRAYSFARSSDL